VQRSDILRAHVGAGKDDTIALFGNVIGQDYGFDETVQALAHLPGSIKLASVGGFTGTGYAERAQEAIKKAGLARRVLYGSTVPFDDVPKLFSGAAFGIIAFKPVSDNLRCALPNRFYDYCTAGVPIFTSEIEDIAHYVRRYDIGAVFPNLEPKTIADTILANLGNLERWRANCAKVAADTCWESAAKDFVASFDGSRLQIALLIKRDITDHGRTHRFYRSLVAAGHEVRIYPVRGSLPGPHGMRDVVHVPDGIVA
jgi:glycosyltransferase involved in cell wall biosynthesis